MINFDEYEKITRPLEVELRDGSVVKIEYFENFMTSSNIEGLNKYMDSLEGNNLAGVSTGYATHLSKELASIEAISKGKRLPDKTEEQRFAILSRLSYQDLQIISAAVMKDLGRPFEKGETPSLDGQEVKEESV